MHSQILFRNFGTGSDTNKISVSIKHHFYIRKDINRFGMSQVYLSVTKGKRARIKLEVQGDIREWNATKQRFRPTSAYNIEQNMILDTVFSKITEIISSFRLQHRMLTLNNFLKEYHNAVPKLEFNSFCRYILENQVKNNVGAGTYARHKSVLEKIKEWKSEIQFHELDEEFIKSFRYYLLQNKKNKATTVNGNLSVVKKYMAIAEKNNIKLPMSAKDISIGTTHGKRVNLNYDEVKKLRTFYFSDYINESQRIILGYFLFSCFTGLRLGDILKLKRDAFKNESFAFVPGKTSHWNSNEIDIKISPKLKEIIVYEPRLFVKKFTGKHMNEELKVIVKFLNIRKKISMHVGRHTFATNYLRAGGTVEKLQVLLRHGSIKQTMGYVHIVNNEAQEEVLKLDEIY